MIGTWSSLETCPECGKKFARTAEWVFVRRDPNTWRHVYYCKWSCFNMRSKRLSHTGKDGSADDKERRGRKSTVDYAAVKTMRQNGKTYRELANMFGLSYSRVYHICNNE